MMKRTLFVIVGIILIMLAVVAFPSCRSYQAPPAPPSPAEQPPTPPSAPSNLTADAVSQTQVILHWIDNSDNEDGFRIYRDGNIVGTVSPNSTTYQDTGLEAGKTYHLVVKAYNVAGESGAGSCIVKTPNPPLNVTVNYIGVKFDHDPMDIQGPGDIRLVLVISDGTQTIEKIIPPGEGTFRLNDYETMELNQRIFHTAVVGEYLKVGIIAYDDDPETLVSDILQAALPVLGPMIGLPDVGGISAVFSQYEETTGRPLFENKDDYVGYFEGFWSQDESWGIGQHSAVGIGDFRVWLSIWSDNEPQPVPKPKLVPDVAIKNVQMVSQVEVGKSHTTTITLRNNESHSLSLTLRGYSSVTGEFFSTSRTILANSEATVRYESHCDTAGERTITYKLFYKGNEIHSWQGTLVATTPSVVIKSVDMPETVEVSKSHTTTITLGNNQSSGVWVRLEAHSSVTGRFFSKDVFIGANSEAMVRHQFYCKTAGERTITYKLFYKGNEIHSWQGTLVVTPTNRAPNIPSNPSPANHAIDVSTFTLSWSGGDPDTGDTVTYDVYFGTSSTPPLLFSNQSGTTVTEPFPMPPASTKCYWKIIATDNHGAATEGPLWDFTTTAEPSIKPPFINANTPTGPSTGKVNQSLTYLTSAETNIVGDLEYRFDWGDGSYSSWSSSPSASHSWLSAGTYMVKAQARLVTGALTSEWSSSKAVKIED